MVNPQEWIRGARSAFKLATALEGDEEIRTEDRCFQLQQCAEKAIKAVLVSQAFEPPKSHDLVSLMNLLEKRMNVPQWARDVGELTNYAVTTRYPGDYSPITADEYDKAVNFARTVFDWARLMISM
jgi:HEPN domain-containing protein